MRQPLRRVWYAGESPGLSMLLPIFSILLTRGHYQHRCATRFLLRLVHPKTLTPSQTHASVAWLGTCRRKAFPRWAFDPKEGNKVFLAAKKHEDLAQVLETLTPEGQWKSSVPSDTDKAFLDTRSNRRQEHEFSTKHILI